MPHLNQNGSSYEPKDTFKEASSAYRPDCMWNGYHGHFASHGVPGISLGIQSTMGVSIPKLTGKRKICQRGKASE